MTFTVQPVDREFALARLSDSTDRSAGPVACWPWTLADNGQGYGRIRLAGRTVYAHRVAYALAFGSIPTGLLVCHRCDNPPCCNPAHLFLGTDGDNQRDKVAKGRQWRRIAPTSIDTALSMGLSVGEAAVVLGASRRTVYRRRAAITTPHTGGPFA